MPKSQKGKRKRMNKNKQIKLKRNQIVQTQNKWSTKANAYQLLYGINKYGNSK